MLYVLNIYRKCLLFRLFGCGIRMHISILVAVEKGHITGWKMVIFGLQNVLLKLNFQDKGHLYANCSFVISTIYPKCHLFQFYSRDILIHITILTGVQNGRISRRRNGHIQLKYFLFEPLFPKWMSLVFKLLVQYSDYLS